MTITASGATTLMQHRAGHLRRHDGQQRRTRQQNRIPMYNRWSSEHVIIEAHPATPPPKINVIVAMVPAAPNITTRILVVDNYAM